MSTHNFREKIASLCHNQRSEWIRSVLSICEHDETGRAIIPSHYVDHWNRMMNTPYEILLGPEKDIDRIDADKFLDAMIEVHTVDSSPDIELYTADEEDPNSFCMKASGM